MRDKTIFEKIIDGEIPAEKVYEDKHTFAFLDINPINTGHTLVIPKKHFRNILDVDGETFARVMETVRFLSPKIKEAVNADGINIGINNEESGGQDVFHLHVHIMPRFIGDELKHWSGTAYKEGEIQEVAGKIRSTINNF